jgi:hypothetical protein
VILCQRYRDLSLLGHQLTSQDLLWLDEAQKIEDRFKFYLLDCRKMLIDIRISLCGSDNLNLPSEETVRKRSLIGRSRKIPKE